MGSTFYIAQQERERILSRILNEDYKYIVALVGTDKETNKPMRGGYQLFKELDEKKIRNYATATATENKVQLSRIEVWALESGLLKEL